MTRNERNDIRLIRNELAHNARLGFDFRGDVLTMDPDGTADYKAAFHALMTEYRFHPCGYTRIPDWTESGRLMYIHDHTTTIDGAEIDVPWTEVTTPEERTRYADTIGCTAESFFTAEEAKKVSAYRAALEAHWAKEWADYEKSAQEEADDAAEEADTMTAEKLDTIVAGLNMRPLMGNEITGEQIGYYLVSAVLIPDLDKLADAVGSPFDAAQVVRMQDGPDGYLYHVICPEYV